MRRLADNLREDIRANMRGLRADLAATAEAARSSARSAGIPDRGSRPYLRSDRTLREAEMLLQAFRDDLRVELRVRAGSAPISAVTLGNRPDGPGSGTDIHPESLKADSH